MSNIPFATNCLINADSIEYMNTLPEHSVDMIFADPPYNLQLSQELYRPDQSPVNGVRDTWDQFDDFGAYDDFTFAWLSAARRILKKNGTIWVIGSYHNIYRIGYHLQNMGFWMLNDVVWIKHNPMPNFKGKRLTNAHETILWAAYDAKAKYQFHYDALKTMNDDIQMRSDWYFPICIGNERLKTKDGDKVHPTQKPEALIYRIMIAASQKGDVILDPFSGSGTTAAVAKKLQRQYIGIERDLHYHEYACTRLDNITPLSDDEILSLTPPKRKEKRIPFGVLIENGYLKVGDTLVSHCGNHHARIHADGSIKTNDIQGSNIQGSIHRIGAQLQNTLSCNGWHYWLYKNDNKYYEIDYLRQQIRQQIHQEHLYQQYLH